MDFSGRSSLRQARSSPAIGLRARMRRFYGKIDRIEDGSPSTMSPKDYPIIKALWRLVARIAVGVPLLRAPLADAAESDSLTIGVSTYPPTIKPLIGLTVANSYVL